MDRYVEQRFPVAGIDLSRAFADQSPRPLPQSQWEPTGQVTVVPGAGPQPAVADVYGRTCVAGVNVRGFEATAQRRRGGSRPGTKKYVAQSVVDGWLVQHLNRVVSTGTPMQPNQMGRVVWLVAVSQGNVSYARAGDSVWTPANNATGNSPPLNFTGVVFSATNGQKMYFADSVNWAYFDPASGTVNKWTATAGSLPVDSANNKPRLICNWRGRICLAGLFKSPQALYMSRTDDPSDWDTNPLNSSASSAFATTVGPQNSPGAPITALIPFNDDVLIIGTDHEIWMCNGDPQANGQIGRLTDAIGIAWGQAWCMDPYGTVYFVSNKMGLYSMVPGQQPQRLSQPIEQLLAAVDTGTNSIRLVWDDRFQGVHVFITPLASAQAATHYFWEARTGAFWQQVFTNNDHNPIAVCDFDGNTTTDRSVLMGGWDGYVRYFDPAAVDDDGTPIQSTVTLGPILSQSFDEMRVDELVVDLGEQSGAVRYEVLKGTTAEAALASVSYTSGTLTASRNRARLIRRAAHAVYVQLSSTVPWAVERIRLRATETGMVRARRK